MSNYDRFSIQAQLQHLQSKYQGTGNASTTKLEWATSIQRDTLASHVGHYSRLAYFAVVENENVKRLRYRFLNRSSLIVAPAQTLPVKACRPLYAHMCLREGFACMLPVDAQQLARAVAYPAPPAEDGAGGDERDAEASLSGRGEAKGDEKNDARSA